MLNSFLKHSWRRKSSFGQTDGLQMCAQLPFYLLENVKQVTEQDIINYWFKSLCVHCADYFVKGKIGCFHFPSVCLCKHFGEHVWMSVFCCTWGFCGESAPNTEELRLQKDTLLLSVCFLLLQQEVGQEYHQTCAIPPHPTPHRLIVFIST